MADAETPQPESAAPDGGQIDDKLRYWEKESLALPEDEIVQREVFGPVVSILGYDTVDEAVQIANDTPYGLAAYIQTGDNDRAERVAANPLAQIRASDRELD